MSIKRLYISKGIMTVALGGVALMSLIGAKKEAKSQEKIVIEKQTEEINALKEEIESIKQREIYTKEEMKEIASQGKIDYIPFDNMKKMEKDIEYIKKYNVK